MSRRILNKRLLVACLDSASLLKNSSPISHSSSIASGNIHGKASVVGRPDVTFARQFSIIPSSWGFGNETKSSNQHDEDKELPTDISDMDQLTESAAMTGVMTWLTWHRLQRRQLWNLPWKEHGCQLGLCNGFWKVFIMDPVFHGGNLSC